MEEVKNKVVEILKDLNIKYERIVHGSVYTMDEAEKACGHTQEEGVKTLLLKSENNDLYLAVLRGDHRLDFKKVIGLIGVKGIKMADIKDLEYLGVKQGALVPFGYQKHLPVLLDLSIAQTKFSYINPGVNTETFKLESKDLIEAVTSWSSSIIAL